MPLVALLVVIFFSVCLALSPTIGSTRRMFLATTPALVFATLPKIALGVDGISVEVLNEGSGPTPQRTQTAKVDYTLWVNGFEKAGKQVDSSKGLLKGPFKFVVGVGQVIPGWDRTVAEMRVGEKRRVVIDPSLGYGEKGMGPIPGNSPLYFEIELLELAEMKPLNAEQRQWLEEHPVP
jgi:hypothetical protein